MTEKQTLAQWEAAAGLCSLPIPSYPARRFVDVETDNEARPLLWSLSDYLVWAGDNPERVILFPVSVELPKPNPRTTENELADYLFSVGVFRYGFEYPKDSEFSRYALAEIDSEAAALEFADRLDDDNQRARAARGGGIGAAACGKARALRSHLGYKRAHPETSLSVASLISPARRVCCGCHKSTSFAPLFPEAE